MIFLWAQPDTILFRLESGTPVVQFTTEKGRKQNDEIYIFNSFNLIFSLSLSLSNM